ncbi:MAG TPA: protein kinase [Bryobacteraceae bacterium]|nr:protein kinase [Bryobacteraceae bacterium]
MLLSGTRIGPYEIAALLGAGGMGEVYRARDPRLSREVAIKILREGVGDPRRFELEARAASKLSHPNIVAIYDVGQEGETLYLVFELIEGESLRTQLEAGPMPLRKMLDIAVQIADGLSAAHAREIAHRDLKPENIMVLRDGHVKILDFGLAKSAETGEGDSETRTARGMLLGTLAYMSPEQAQGRSVDFRSDQFSLGAILYEMATGEAAFRRADRVSTLSAVAREEPPPLAIANPSVPAPLRWVIERCLAKEPAQRYASTADLYHQLRDIRDHLSEAISVDSSISSVASPGRQRLWKRWLAAAGATVVAALAFLAGAATVGQRADPGAYHFTPFTTEAAGETDPAWSPDGKALAYTAMVSGAAEIFARHLDALIPAQVTSASSDCRYPFWSRDGSRIYYWSASALWSVAPAGGEPREVIGDVSFGQPPAAVSPDGRTLAYFGVEGQQQSVRLMPLPNGGSVEYKQAPFPGRFRLAGGMQFSPDGRKLLVWLTRDLELGSELWVLPYPSGRPRRVECALLRDFQRVTASWAADNRHIAIAIAPSLGRGDHIYLLDTENGAYEPITSGTGEESQPGISPDGDRIAFTSGGVASRLVEASTDGASVSPLLVTARHQYDSDWAPSGWQFAYVSDASGVPEVWLRSISEGWSMPVIRDSADGHLGYAAPRFSPDGQKLAYVRVGLKHLIWISSLSGGVAAPLEQESRDQHAPAWSPDGRWLAYVRFVGSKWEIAKAPSGGGARPVPVGDGGAAGSKLEWSPSGDWICFSEGDALRVIAPSGGTAAPLAKNAATFTFARDGGSIIVVRRNSMRKWELVRVSVPAGLEGKPVPLNLPPQHEVTGARLHPEGRRLVLSVSAWNQSIWILDGLRKGGRRSLLDRLRIPGL